jgi:hypothetical protein
MSVVLFATSLGPLQTAGGPVKVLSLFAGGHLVTSTTQGVDADVLAAWASRSERATLTCSPELAEAGKASGWRAVPWAPELLDARIALIASLSSSGRLRNFRDPAPVVALVNAGARLVRTPISTDISWVLQMSQRRHGAWTMETTSGLTAYVGANPLHSHIDVFATEAAMLAYVADLARGDLQAAAKHDLTNVRMVSPMPELVPPLRERHGVDVIAAPSRAKEGAITAIDPAYCWWLAGALDAVATLSADPDAKDATSTLTDGRRRYETQVRVLRREWVRS